MWQDFCWVLFQFLLAFSLLQVQQICLDLGTEDFLILLINQVLISATIVCWATWLSRNDIVFKRTPPNNALQVLFWATYWIGERSMMYKQGKSSALRLTPTVFAPRWHLCLHDFSSNSECKSEGKLPSEERGDAKMNSLSPRRQTASVHTSNAWRRLGVGPTSTAWAPGAGGGAEMAGHGCGGCGANGHTQPRWQGD